MRAGPPLAVCVRDDDVCVPVCKDGIGMSQVMYLVCHGMKRGLPTHRVCVPHGAVEGFDPHTAFAPPLDEGSVFEYMFQAMLPRGAVPVEWSAEAFFKQFGVDRARRAGEVTAALNNIELNPADFTKHNPAVLSKLSKQRTQQRRAMDALVYDVAALNRYRGPGGRLIIIAFTKSVSVYLSRLLEVSGSKDMSGVCLIACPYEDASRAAGALPDKERDAAAASAFLAAYTLLGNVFVSLRTAGRPEFNARLAFDMAGQLRMIEEATARLRGLCPTLDTPMLNSAMGGGGFAAAGGFNTPLMAVSRLPPECILARETVQFRDKLSHGSHSIILRALYLGQPVVVKVLVCV